jgi:Tol biopolymer transport system component
MKDLVSTPDEISPLRRLKIPTPVLDLARGIDSRLSSNADGGRNPAWSPDGKWIAYSSVSIGSAGLYPKDAANDAPERRILQTRTLNYLDDWSRDGRFLIYTGVSLKTGFRSLWAIPDPLGSGEPKPIALWRPP